MLTLRKVAVTGELGAGKTTLCRLLQEQGAFVVSADALVHQLLSPKTAVGQKVIQLLGRGILVDNKIEHHLVADLVFEDRHLLLELEKIIHPAVLEEIETAYQSVKQEKISLFVAEVPLLYEGHFERAFDQVICITAPEELCKKRFIENKKMSEKEYLRRKERLIPIEEKCIRADFVIKNEGSLDELKSAVMDVYNKLTS